jgi:hypothetical protein
MVSAATSQNPTPNIFDRNDITIERLNGKTNIIWTPQGPSLDEKCVISFCVNSRDTSYGAEIDMVRSAVETLEAEGAISANPLKSEFAQKMLSFARVARVENCTIENVTVTSNCIGESTSFRHVKFLNSEIAVRGDSLNLEAVTFGGCRMYIEAKGGTFDEVVIDRASTVAGDLGSTVLNKDCRMHGYAVDLRMNDVSWEEPASVPDRTVGLLFKLKSVDPAVFVRRKALTNEEFKAACEKRNEDFPVRTVIDVLKNPPFEGTPWGSSAPLDAGLKDLKIAETTKVGFHVMTSVIAGSPAALQYLVEIPTGLPVAPSVIYRVDPASSADLQAKLHPETRACTNSMLVVEVLKRFLDDVPSPVKRAPIQRSKRPAFSPASGGVTVDGTPHDPFADLWFESPDERIQQVL